MKIYKNIPETNVVSKTAITIGSFDGVHLGHQKVINSLKAFTKKACESTVVTFHPTPQHFLLKKKFKGYITSKNEKIDLIKKLGIDNLCIIEFDYNIKALTAKSFLEKIVRAFSPDIFIMGFNHSFGKDRAGDIDFLKNNQEKYSFKTIELNEVSNNKNKISSSRIRNLLQSGKLKEANIALGRYYPISGIVVPGKGLGKKIGFPTANILITQNKIIPGNGVYFVEAVIDTKKFKGMCNIGHNPTVSSKKQLSVEIHFFNLSKDIYDKEVNIRFIEFLRTEKKFKNIKFLKEQLKLDMNKCLEYSLYNV